MIGVAGTGLMGYPIAKRLLSSGYEVVVWNRTRERALPLAKEGALVAESPSELAENSELVLVVVADDEASRAVLEQVTSVGRRLDVVNHSTVTPMHSKRAYVTCRERGCRYLALPVMGGPTEAERGELFGMAGGDREVLDRWADAIGRYVREVVFVGTAEAAAAMKLAINSIYFSSMVSLAEALLLTEKWGVSYEKFREVAEKLWIKVILDRYASRVLADEQPVRFKLRLAAKDMLYALLAGAEKGQPLPPHRRYSSTVPRGRYDRRVGRRGLHKSIPLPARGGRPRRDDGKFSHMSSNSSGLSSPLTGSTSSPSSSRVTTPSRYTPSSPNTTVV